MGKNEAGLLKPAPLPFQYLRYERPQAVGPIAFESVSL